MIQATDLAQAEARMPRWMLALALLGISIAMGMGQGRFAAGFALGAAIGILNYYWLHQAIAAMLDVQRTRIPVVLVVKIALRYPLAFAGIYLFYRTGWLPFSAILTGLFVPAGGVLWEAALQIRAGLRQHEPV